MAITVKIPSQLRAATGGEGELEVEGGTVGEALDAVFDQHDGLRERITQDGDLRRFVNVYVSGEDIRFQDGLDTADQRRRRSHDPPGRRRRWPHGLPHPRGPSARVRRGCAREKRARQDSNLRPPPPEGGALSS